MYRHSFSHKTRVDTAVSGSTFYTENLLDDYLDEQQLNVRRNNSLQSIPTFLDLSPSKLKKLSTMTDDIFLFKGFVRRRNEQIVSTKKSRDQTWHTFWAELTGSTFSFYRVKYLLSSVCDEQPLPTKQPPNTALVLDSIITILDCKAEKTPPEICTNKLALDTCVLTLAGSNGLLCFIATRSEASLLLLTDCINGNFDINKSKCTPDTPSSHNNHLPIDPEIDDLLGKIFERKLLLEKLDEMKWRFSGIHHLIQNFRVFSSSEDGNDAQVALTLVCPFILKLNKPYFMVPGIDCTLVTPDDKIKVFGLMEDGRCRCQVLREASLDDYQIYENNFQHMESSISNENLALAPINNGCQATFPIIGSIPLSLIATSKILSDSVA